MSNQFLSHFINEQTPGYGGSKGVEIEIASTQKNGDSSNSQLWKISNHIGTHIDCPRHFDLSGKSLSEYSASEWIFTKPYLLEVEVGIDEIITHVHFEEVPKDSDMILLKTGFEKYRGKKEYWNNNPGLSPDLARWLRENRKNVKVIGFDFISITSYQNRPLGRVAHKSFLSTEHPGEPLRVIEDMHLSDLDKSPSKIIVAPILVENADGAQVTVISIS